MSIQIEVTVVNYVIDSCFIVDVFLNFFLAYYDHEAEVSVSDVFCVQ